MGDVPTPFQLDSPGQAPGSVPVTPASSFSTVPSAPFRPRRGLRGPHRQTLASQVLQRRIHLPPAEERLFQVEPEVQVLCRCHWQQPRRLALTVLIVHGLEGSSESQYVLGATAKALAAGMNVVRMNVRNCGGTEALGPTLYHSGLSADVGVVACTLLVEEKLPRLALLGFSMGGNLVLKMAGEWGREAPPELRALCAVSPAVDLAPSAAALHRPSNWIYEQYFLWSLRRHMRRKARLYPGRYEARRLRRVWTLQQFDDRITAPYCGFTSAADYYARASAARVVERIAVPALLIHSNDDPFIHILPETRARLRANSCVQYIETEHGGHCGFLADPDGYDGRWAERTLVEFLTRF
ncbi:MAG TPA: alpha/beta fold hydrolase [Terriglobales bacterium]|nr:alpha/beta fold hydrolase [Terriglobales bacterium]